MVHHPADGDEEPAPDRRQCVECGDLRVPAPGHRCPNPACDSDELEPAPLSRRGTVWSYTENRYAPPPPFTAPDPFEPYALAAVELEAEGLVVLGQVADGVCAADLARRAWRWSSCSARCSPTTTRRSTVGLDMWAPAAPCRSMRDAPMSDDIVVLGVGMHPWGKWGRNFVEYGVAAARAALADAGLAWSDVAVRRRRRHHPQRLPGLHRRGRPSPRARAGPACRCRRATPPAPRARTALQRGPGPDPRRLLRRRPGRRRRHHAEGLLRPGRRRPPRRPGLAALPPARRHQPRLLRPLRPPAHGRLRRHRRGLRPGQGEERRHGLANPNARYRKEVTVEEVLASPDGGRPAAPARHLRHQPTAGRR